LLFAHQGGALEAPANTLYAFATAVAAGADALELDIHASADGQLVVVHDATVDRTTDGHGAVDHLTLSEITALDAAHFFVPQRGTTPGLASQRYAFRGIATGHRPPPPGYGPEDFQIPTLRDVLAAFPDVLINIDIKRTHPETAPYERALADELRAAGRGDDTMVASFLHAALGAFVAADGDVSTAATPDEVAAFWSAVHEDAAMPDLAHRRALQVPATFAGTTVVTAAFVTAAHACGLAVHVWTINDAATVGQLLALGVDGVVTDRPRALADVVHTPGRRSD
jgi:glycerophosphoryl diester phosphodiesterase